MGRRLCSLLMIPLLLLCGCGAGEARLESEFDALRQKMTETTGLAARCEMMVTAGGTVEDYVLELAYDGRRSSVTVLEPEILAGIRAEAERGETELVYENVRLGAGALDETGLTPASALPAMIDAVQSGYVELLWREAPYLCARLHVSDRSVLTLWITEDTLTPAVGEIASEGETLLRWEFTDWTIE